jgi:cation-transporting ATPase E
MAPLPQGGNMTASSTLTAHAHDDGTAPAPLREATGLDFPIGGLTAAQVLERRRAGQSNDVAAPTSRPYRDILATNLLNPINLTLFGIGAVMIAIGRFGDALSGVGIVLFNVIVGVAQEIRAKRQLDRIALLMRPKVTVLRDGSEQILDPDELVLGDMVVVRPGDQLVVDGTAVGDGRIDMDESLLTGESDLRPKAAGDTVLSGSFCVSGTALVEAARVGKDSYANQLTARARKFEVTHTPLQSEINSVLRLLALVAGFILGTVWIASLFTQIPLARELQMASIIVGLIPNGLLVMIVIAYALGAVRIAQRGALVQQSNAVESLSNVTVLCTDKTGTLTANKIHYADAYPVGVSKTELESLLGSFAHSTSALNKTTEALAAALPGEHQLLSDEVPFSSGRKWSAIACDGARADAPLHGVYVLGALEMLAPHMQVDGAALERLHAWSDEGLRVLAFARQPAAFALHNAEGQPALPDLELIGLVSLRDELRPHIEETLAQFTASGIALKVISGDSPETVAALARQAGLRGELATVSGPELAQMDEAQLQQATARATIFGRIAPEQKEQLVRVLRAQGHYVAMMGDGVNDVLSVKHADVGIAMQSGSAATRGVADMILLGDSFESLPAAFREGQRIVNGMKDILCLFLARILYATLFIVAMSVINVGFPFVPKQNTLFVLLTVGLPTLALALWARPEPLSRRSLNRQVMHFVFPAGIAIFLFGLAVYLAAYNWAGQAAAGAGMTPEALANLLMRLTGIDHTGDGLAELVREYSITTAQSVLTAFLVFMGLLLIVFVEPPVRWLAGGDALSEDRRPTYLAGALLLAYALIVTIAPVRESFELMPLAWWVYAASAGAALACGALLLLAWRGRWLERFLDVEL